MKIYEVIDPFCDDKLRVMEDERLESLDKYALKSQHEENPKLVAVADKWHLAYFTASLVDEWAE